MTTPKNLEEGKPIQEESLELEVATEDKSKYVIKIALIEDKLTFATSYRNGLIYKEYYSEYDLNKLAENTRGFSFKNIREYYLFLKDLLENNKLMKLENKIKKENTSLDLEIPAKLGIIKEIKYEIKEKELNEKEIQNNIIEFVNKLYLENEELKKQISELKSENDNKKQIERVKNLFKESTIVKLDEKKMINDWIDPYNEKNITSELLFTTNKDGDSSNTFHNKCNGKGPTITFIKTTNGKRIGGFANISWASTNSYRADPDAFIFSLDASQKFVQYRNFTSAIYDHSSYGPTFGNGHDIYIASGCKSNTSSYCNNNYVYGFFYSYNMVNVGTQQTTFQVTDYEVYLIKINK